MQISREAIAHLAELARIRLTEEEIERFSQELPAILAFVDQLKTAPEDALPATGGTFLDTVLRSDEPVDPLSDPGELRKAFLKQDQKGNLIVPKIFDHGA